MAAAALVRTLRGLTLRMADPELSPVADAAAAIKAALPLLLAKGRGSSCLWSNLPMLACPHRWRGSALTVGDSTRGGGRGNHFSGACQLEGMEV